MNARSGLPHDVEPVAAVLAEIPLFRVLGEKGIRSTAQAGVSRRYRAGQIIFHQGDPGESLFVLLDGLVKVVFTTEHGDEIVLNMLSRGDTFGEMALLDGSPRSASITTVRPAWVFALPRARLLELMREHPGLADEFLRLLGRMVRRTPTRRPTSPSSTWAGGWPSCCCNWPTSTATPTGWSTCPA